MRYCSLVLLKSPALVNDYGRGLGHVKNFLDAAHSSSYLVPEEYLSKRLDRLTERNGSLSAVYFGSLTEYKGLDRMIRAVAHLKSWGEHAITLTIIGVGEQREALVALVRELSVADQVKFIGAIPYGSELFRELRDHDVLLATPLSPDTPRNALDAMASGLPIIAFDISYYRDLSELSGAVVLTPWLDERRLAEALLSLARDQSTLKTLSASARIFAAQNTQEAWLATRAEWTRTYCLPTDRKQPSGAGSS